MRRCREVSVFLAIIVGASMLSAAGCTPPSQVSLKESSVAYATGDYKIGPEDILEVSVWRNPDLTKVVIVRPDGKISLPLVGDVYARGLTAAELSAQITERFKEYKESPLVSVTVQQINSYEIYILGEVGHTGRYQLKNYTTVLQAITMAGGFSLYASKNKIFLLRKSPDTHVESRFNIRYDDIVSGKDPSQNLILIPGDTVVVP
jgi:polysaccharide biosynthesis/export protein